MSTLSNSFESLLNSVDTQVNNLYSRHITESDNNNNDYNSNFNSERIDRLRNIMRSDNDINNNDISILNITNRNVNNLINSSRHNDNHNNNQYNHNNYHNQHNEDSVTNIHNRIHHYVNNNGNIDDLHNIINNFMNINDPIPIGEFRHNDMPNDIRNNDIRNNDDDINNYRRVIDNSFQEDEQQYHARHLNQHDVNDINSLYRLRGKVGECNICCEETYKVCQCHTCNFQYCQGCLSRILTDFNKCSSCNQDISVTEMKQITIQSEEHNETVESTIQTASNSGLPERNRLPEGTRLSIVNNYRNNSNTMNTRVNRSNRSKRDTREDNMCIRINGVSHRTHHIPIGKKKIIEKIGFLDYQDNTTGEKISVYTTYKNNRNYTVFKSSINGKSNIELDSTLFENDTISHFHTLLTHKKIQWDHFNQLYKNNYTIIKSDNDRKNEFINTCIFYLYS